MIKKDLSKMIYYFRISTLGQSSEGITVEHYKQRGYNAGFTDDQIIYDIASGTKSDRKGYIKIKDLASLGRIEAIALPDDLSRITRDLEEFQILKKLLLETNVKLLNLSFNEYRFETPEEDLQGNIVMSFAQYEARRNQYRALKGHEFLRQEGRAVRPVFPYVKPNDKLLPNTSKYKNTNKTTWEIGREIIETFIKEQNISKTIKIMTLKYGEKSGNFWEDFARDHSGLRDWLNCQSIRGNLEYFGGRRYKRKKNAPEPILLYNTHEPLISEEEYHQIELIFKISGQTRTKASRLRNLWVGKLFCECGAPMKISGSKSGKNYFWYVVCKSAYPNSSNVKARQALGLETACKHRSSYGLTLKKLEDIVIEGLCSKAIEIANTHFPEKDKQFLPPEVIELNKQIQTYQLLAENDPDIVPLLEKKLKRREYLLGKQQAEGNLHTANLRNKLITYGQDKDFWLTATSTERKLLYADLIEKIVCVKGVPEISFLV